MASAAEVGAAENEAPSPSPLQALWRSITKLERGKLNSPYLAFRNAVAVAVPLSIGIALGNSAAGAAVATGALNVSYSDGSDPYSLRARRMLTWSVLGAVAVFSGSAAGPHHWIAIVLAAVWAFLAGLLLSISQKAGDLGLNTLVAVIVFSARGPSGVGEALEAALLVLAGGLLQTGFALLFWPVHRYDPERQAIGSVYEKLAQSITSQEEEALTEPLASAPSAQVQDAMAALDRDYSVEGERFRLLFDQSDRIRLSAFLLRRLQSYFAYQSMSISPEAAARTDELVKCVDAILENASALLRDIATALATNRIPESLESHIDEAERLTAEAACGTQEAGALSNELCSAIQTFAGQVRAVGRLVTRSTFEGSSEFQLKEAAKPWRLQIQSWLGTLMANLNINSPSFRHGLRMAVFVALGTAIGRSVNWQRTYWLPMTVAVILKPDFTTTLSRGVLRLMGTLVGLVVATGLYHAIPSSALPELILVAVFTFALRMYGPGNYGIFTVAVTGLIVFLIAAIGTPPAEVVLQRGLNTLAGGCLALVAYGIWPTWERRRVPEVMADMIDSVRVYLRAVMTEFDSANGSAEEAASKARLEWRRNRSAAEASVDRVSSEPKVTRDKLSCLNSMLATSHAMVHAIMSLEAGVQQSRADQYPDAFRAFSHDVEFTLYYLAAVLRGSNVASGSLPNLRDAHGRLVEESGTEDLADDYLLVETDRLVVTANTLREQVFRFANS